MNREILKSTETDWIPVERLISLMQTFSLKHATRALPDLLETTDSENATSRPLEEFDPLELESGITQA